MARVYVSTSAAPQGVSGLLTINALRRQNVRSEGAWLRTDPDESPGVWEREGGERLREQLGSSLEQFQNALTANRVAIRIAGLPSDKSPPPSPYLDELCWPDIPITLTNVFGVINLLNAHAFAYRDENAGRVVRNVVARVDAGDEYSSQGWRHDLGPHMDDAFRPVGSVEASLRPEYGAAPRWLIFGVIYNQPKVPLRVAAVDDLVKALAKDQVTALCSSDFDVHSPASFEKQNVSRGVPMLISDEKGGWFSRLDYANCVGTTDSATRALASVYEILGGRDLWDVIDLQCGDVIVVDNYRALHQRALYSPRWNGADRWLVRVYAAPDDVRGAPASTRTPHVWK